MCCVTTSGHVLRGQGAKSRISPLRARITITQSSKSRHSILRLAGEVFSPSYPSLSAVSCVVVFLHFRFWVPSPLKARLCVSSHPLWYLLLLALETRLQVFNRWDLPPLQIRRSSLWHRKITCQVKGRGQSTSDICCLLTMQLSSPTQKKDSKGYWTGSPTPVIFLASQSALKRPRLWDKIHKDK